MSSSYETCYSNGDPSPKYMQSSALPCSTTSNPCFINTVKENVEVLPHSGSTYLNIPEDSSGSQERRKYRGIISHGSDEKDRTPLLCNATIELDSLLEYQKRATSGISDTEKEFNDSMKRVVVRDTNVPNVDNEYSKAIPDRLNFLCLPTLPNDSQYYDSIEEEVCPPFENYSICSRFSQDEKGTTVGDSSQDTSSRSSFRMESLSSSRQSFTCHEEKLDKCELISIKHVESSGFCTGNNHQMVSPNLQPDSPNLPCQSHVDATGEDDNVDEEELSELLVGQKSSCFTKSWKHHTHKQRLNNSLQFQLAKEKLQGVIRIRSQLSQATQVFRELAYLINDQQDDLDLLDHSVNSVKNSITLSLDELHKASRRKALARRRKFFVCAVAGVVAFVVYLVYFGEPTNVFVSSSQSQLSQIRPLRHIRIQGHHPHSS